MTVKKNEQAESGLCNMHAEILKFCIKNYMEHNLCLALP
jgi:hypothetical protein